MKPKTVAYLQLALLALGIGLFVWLTLPTKVSVVPQVILTAADEATSTKPAFGDVVIEAKSAYVYDSVTGEVLFEKNSDLQLPLASLTKVMTALTASNLLEDRDLVRITGDDLREEGDSGLVADEEWSVKNLIDFSLIVSSNDGARALASVAGAFLRATRASSTRELPVAVPATSSAPSTEAFVREMNATADRLGLHESYFLNSSGLDVSATLAGGYGSAKDMSLLVDRILKTKPHLLEATSFHQLSIPSNRENHAAVNTNKAIDMIPNVIASKTGFTDLAGGNLVVAFDAGMAHPIIIAVLGSSFDGRFQDMAQLVGYTVEYLAKK
jgi:serine-type D-Ala-D-Ala carboxypeptidase (penicillin-binding protein 5/6)